MGIKGFLRFLESCKLYKPYELRDTRVIIDGKSLAYYLYTQNEVDCRFGGDYSRYAETVKEYFTTFFECSITPIIVFASGQETSDEKGERLEQKQNLRMRDIAKIVKGEEIPFPVFPILAYEIFKSILIEMNITYAQSDFEGNKQTAALAKAYKCPLLSDDSDFYMYDLPEGFIRFSNIDLSEFREKNNTNKCLNCTIYYVDSLLEKFTLKDKKILSVFAVLVGNNIEDFKQFYFKINVRYKNKLEGVLSWLRGKFLHEAINQIVEMSPNWKKEKIENDIKRCIANFELKDKDGVQLMNILTVTGSELRKNIPFETSIFTPCGIPLPQGFTIAFNKGLISSMMLDIIREHKNLLYAQVEDFSNVSSHFCSRYIRQVIYSILLRHDPATSDCHRKTCLKPVKEYDRQNDKMLLVNVEFLQWLKNGDSVPMLTEIYNMQKEQLRHFITSVLEVDENFLKDIPNHLQLLFGCISYWLLRCQPKPTKQFLSALLICIVYFYMKRISKKGTDISEDTKIVRSISRFDAHLVVENLQKYLQKPEQGWRNSFNIRVIHSYSQLQSCLFACTELNSLLNFPLEPLQFHESLNGAMLYNLIDELESKFDSDYYIKYILGGNDTANELFIVLMNKLLDKIPLDYLKL